MARLAGDFEIRDLNSQDDYEAAQEIQRATWGRDFTVYHPHVHFVVPGGGVSEDGSRWQAGPANFLLPEKAASTVYRAKFRDAMKIPDEKKAARALAEVILAREVEKLKTRNRYEQEHASGKPSPPEIQD